MRARTRLALLLLTILVPVLLIQAVIFAQRYRSSYRLEIQADLEAARAVAQIFEGFVADVLHQEQSIGAALTVSAPLPAAAAQVVLQKSANEYPEIDQFIWIGPDGRQIASSQPGMADISHADRPDFREILDGKEWVVSDLQHESGSDRPSFAISRAVFGDERELLGVVMATVQPDLLERLGGFQREGAGSVILFDRKGMGVYRRPAAGWTWETRDLLTRFPALRGVLEGREIRLSIPRSPGEEERLYAFSPIPLTGWAAGADRSSHETLQPLASSLLWQAALFLLSVLAAVLPALLISQSITSPLDALRRQVLLAAGGTAGEASRVSIFQGPREVRELTDAFRQMESERNTQQELLSVQYERVKELARTMRSMARARSRSLDRLSLLIDLSARILSESSLDGLAQQVALGARQLVPSDSSFCGYGALEAGFRHLGTFGGAPEVPSRLYRGLFEWIGERGSFRLNREGLHAVLDPLCSDSSCPPWRGLLGARLTGPGERTGGLIVLARQGKTGFNLEDEVLLAQLAALATLGVRHIESRRAAEERAAEAEGARRILEALMKYVPEGITLADARSGRVVQTSAYGLELIGRSLEEVIGATLEEHAAAGGIYHQNGRTPARSADLPISRAVRHGEIVTDEEWVVHRPDGTRIPVLCNAGPIRNHSGEIVGGVVVFRDIRSIKETRALLEERVRERTAQLDAANAELQAEIRERRKAEELLQRIIDNIPVMLLFYGPGGRISLINRETERLMGWNLEEMRGNEAVADLYRGAGDLSESEWRDIVIRTRSGRQLPTAWSNMRLTDGSQIGIGIDITERKASEEKLLRYQHRLRALAAELALTAERERQKLAAEVHDRIGQALSLSRMKLGVLRHTLVAESGRDLDEICRLLDESIQDVRGLLLDLYPPVLRHAGLHAALDGLLERFRDQHGLIVELDDRAAAESPGRELEILLFRGVQELLTNVVRHAGTTRARILICREKEELLIAVEDQGSGFSPEEADTGRGFGIFNIREQLELLGGSLELDTLPGRGTRVSLRVPLGA